MTAECVNTQAYNQGLHQFPVRDTAKVCRMLLIHHTIAHDLLRTFALTPEVLRLGKAVPAALALAV